jgi:hypothetical protein
MPEVHKGYPRALCCGKKNMIGVKNRFLAAVLLVMTGMGPAASFAQGLTKVAFPYGPLGLNSLPWVADDRIL